MIHPLGKAAALLGTATLLLVSFVSAQETYVLATPGAAPAPGTTLTTTRIFTSDLASVKITPEGRTPDITISAKDTFVETFQGIDSSKLRRTLSSIESKGMASFNGMKTDTPIKTDGLLETPVVLTRDAGKWSAALEKGRSQETQSDDLRKLAALFNRDPAFAAYGDTPRKPGDKWNAGLAAFSPEIFGEYADVETVDGTFTIEFVGIKQQEGIPCAQLKAVFDLKGELKASRTYTFQGEGEILRSLRDQVDLEWKYTTLLNFSDKTPDAKEPAKQMSGTVIITGTTTVKR